MKKYLVLGLGLLVSIAAFADHHAGKGPPPGRPMFEMMDTDQDGKISQAEHEAALEKMLKNRRAHFSEMDADGDGMIDQEEAQAAHEKMREKRMERRAEWRKQREADTKE